MPVTPSSPFVILRRAAGRQVLFFSAVVVLTGVASWFMADILWQDGLTRLECASLVLFIPLFGMVAFGFIQALFGFFILLRKEDPYSQSRILPEELPPPKDMPPTAIVIPIYNEDVSRVYEGLRTIYLDLVRSGYLDRFDFFILSDSNDPNKWIEEEVAWIDLCKQINGFGRIFYRKRRVNINRKSGNISDFLRHWGRKYRHMVVLDADSLMEATTLVRLVQLMELNPQAGIIQTVPKPIQGRTFFARMIQFSYNLYGPIFLAGLNYWQAGSGNFWGHNAIIRIAPFMDHCGLPTLTGSGSGRFMSHDFVEAALMRRANYEVWMVYELGGSYENLPPTVVDAAVRDRRWCRGNLQHAWLLSAKGLYPITRLHLFLGILSYFAAPLWLLFLLVGTFQIWLRWIEGGIPSAGEQSNLSTLLGIGSDQLALLLFFFTMGLLTIPKILAIYLAFRNRDRRRAFGGRTRLFLSFVLEHSLSALLAPILMIFQSCFILEVLTGRDVAWNAQRRDADDSIDWGGILRTHALHTVIGIFWAMVLMRISPALFWWMSPITFGLMGSIPISVLLSMTGIGEQFAKWGLFVMPDESKPSPVVTRVEKNLEIIRKRLPPPAWLAPHYGLSQVVLDPYINASHSSLLRQKHRLSRPLNVYVAGLTDRLITKGPADLNRREQMALLMNPQAVLELHDRIWRLPEAQLSPWWKLAMRHYNSLTDQPQTPLYR